jgi:hypothetical protein
VAAVEAAPADEVPQDKPENEAETSGSEEGE